MSERLQAPFVEPTGMLMVPHPLLSFFSSLFFSESKLNLFLDSSFDRGVNAALVCGKEEAEEFVDWL